MIPRVLLVDDDVSIRQMLHFVLARTCSCEVVGEYCDGQDALKACEQIRPDILITDLRMPRLCGVELLHEIRRRRLGSAVIFYTAAASGAGLQDAVQAEPNAFVLKSDDLASLRLAVASVSTGGTFWAPRAEELRKECEAASRALARLTSAERRVLKLLADGKTTKEIAITLSKSEHTVSHQRQSLMDKLGLHNAVALTAAARWAGLSD